MQLHKLAVGVLQLCWQSTGKTCGHHKPGGGDHCRMAVISRCNISVMWVFKLDWPTNLDPVQKISQ
jgi:hypothetical protein